MKIKKLFLAIIFLLGFMLILPIDSEATTMGTIKGDQVRIRTGPGINYSIITHSNSGESFEVVSSAKGWVQVQLNDGKLGWVVDYLIDISTIGDAIVLNSSLKVHQEASLRTPVVGILSKNEPVEILKEINGWYEITSVRVNGWVYGNLLNSNFKVSATSLNIYKDASVKSIVNDKLSKNDSGVIQREINGWFYIKSGQREGWIYKTHITDGSPSTNTQQDNETPAIVLINNLQVHQQESTRTPIVGYLSKDEPVKISKEINGWYQIKSSKINGWVYGNLLSADFKVKASSLNIYKEASVRSTPINQLNQNKTGLIVKEINGWYYIKSEEKEGWIYKTHLTEGSPVAETVIETVAIVLPTKLQVHQKESTRTPIIGYLSKDDPVKIVKEINGWYQITSPKINGWVYGNLLSAEFKVSATSLNIYQDASLRTTTINQLNQNEIGQIEKEINGWYYIKSGEKEGWIYKSHITEGSPITETVVETAAIVLPTKLQVYQKESTRTPLIGYLSKNDPVKIVKEINGWYQITSTNINGWVYGNLLISDFKVSAEPMYVYKEARLNSAPIIQLKKGQTGKIIQEINGWYYIQYAEEEGWIYYKHLVEGSPQYNGEIIIENPKAQATVLTNNLKVYEKESMRTPVIGSLKEDEIVTIIREINGWYSIKTFSGFTGWVYGNLLKFENTVQVKNVDVYLKATTRTTISDTLTKGQQITIKKVQNGWYQIQFGANEGWVYKSHLLNGSPKQAKLLGLTKNSTNVYFEPSSSSEVLGTVSSNEKIIVTREVNGFYWIETSNLKGWIPVNTTQILTKYTSIVGKTIVLDPGHGGSDSGAVGKVYNTYEKIVNLETVNKIYKKLTDGGANVILTRSDDKYLTLPERVVTSHANNTDLFVSVHYNSAGNVTGVAGIETLYYHDRDISIASYIQNSLIKYTNRNDRGHKYQNLHVLRENNNPSVLLELGFLSNPEEELLARSSNYQELAATAVVEGIINYFNSIY